MAITTRLNGDATARLSVAQVSELHDSLANAVQILRPSHGKPRETQQDPGSIILRGGGDRSLLGWCRFLESFHLGQGRRTANYRSFEPINSAVRFRYTLPMKRICQRGHSRHLNHSFAANHGELIRYC